jgi:4-hydroxy-tetrahydrodipicolinate synthase
MSYKRIFEGAATAIVTPFNALGVDFAGLERLIEFQISKGIDALVVCGTTGEASTMDDDEHKEVIRFAVEKVAGRVPVIAGTGSNNTLHAVYLSQYAQEAGADMVLVVPPYYNKTTQKGLVLHFNEIAKSIAIPVMLYNIPTRTGMNINVDTMVELAKTPNIIAVKECNMDQVADVVSKTPDDFTVYSGDDANILTVMAYGGKGVVSVLGNIMPKEVHDIVTLFSGNRIRESRELFYKVYDLVKALFLETNPIPIKKACSLMNMDSGLLRMPLVEMGNDNAEKLKSEMVRLNLI